MANCIDQVLEEFRIPLKNFIKRRVPNDQDAEDILQDVFLKIYQNIAYITDKNKIYAWVYTLTRNTIKDNSREIVSTWAPGSKVEDYVASYIIEALKGEDIRKRK